MFTHRRILLSELADVAGMTVLRDVEIAFAGKIPTALDCRVVPVSSAVHLDAAEAHGGIAAMIVPAALADDVPTTYGLAVSEEPVAALTRLQASLSAQEDFQWQSFSSRIDPSAHIDPSARIATRDVVIGAGTYVGPNAVIRPRSIVGTHCKIDAGCVVGADAFEADVTHPGGLVQASGGVEIGDHVTLQPNCVVGRATFGGFTKIGAGTLIDAGVSISHDCVIGAEVTICANASLSGRVVAGQGAYVGPSASLSNGVVLGDKCVVSIGSVVTKAVAPNTRVTGNFALPHAKWLALIRKFR